ncbi:MAG: flagellar basal body P-ring protein FlgI [Planctomycetota bacterium]
MKHAARNAFILTIAAGVFMPRVDAGVQLQHICTVAGQQEIKLTGLGLVVGLDGTGDGGRNLPAMRALATALRRLDAPATPDELGGADNVAVVAIEATVPATGLRRGQRIDCVVSSLMGADSLVGGRLMFTPMEAPSLEPGVAVGLASGPVTIEDPTIGTSGKVSGGLVLEENIVPGFVDESGPEPKISLLLSESRASFHTARDIAYLINHEFEDAYSGDAAGRPRTVALAVGPGTVEVLVPPQYRADPVTFVAEVLDVNIDRPNTAARVVVNPKTGTVVVTGEVELSPVVITHRNLTVRVGNDFLGPPPDTFAVLDTEARDPGPVEELVQALNELRVPTEDVIHILRELHRSGKLHAEFIEH